MESPLFSSYFSLANGTAFQVKNLSCLTSVWKMSLLHHLSLKGTAYFANHTLSTNDVPKYKVLATNESVGQTLVHRIKRYDLISSLGQEGEKKGWTVQKIMRQTWGSEPSDPEMVQDKC